MIQIEHLTKTYSGASHHKHHALHDVSLTINDGEVYGIIGASGAGKSTLVRCINLLEQPTDGCIIIDGNDVTNCRGKRLLELRSSIGMIFQHFSLFEQRTVLKNVTFPLELHKNAKPHREARARELLELVGLSDKAESYPSQLSGGQKQRVAIARALALAPKIILCDEATSALDTRTTASILELLKGINEKLGVTMLVITHSLTVADKICDKIAVIDGGQIVEQGTTRQVLSSPRSPVTRELLHYDRLTSAANGKSGETQSSGAGSWAKTVQQSDAAAGLQQQGNASAQEQERA